MATHVTVAISTPTPPASIMRALRVAARALLLAGIAAGTMELCARIDDTLTTGVPLTGRAPTIESLFRETPDGGKEGVPFARFGKWRLNSLGLRTPELVPGRVTVACFGASETFGEYEDDGFEYPRALERLLNARSSRFQVVNAALPGLSVVTDDTAMRTLLPRLQPRIAIVYPSIAASIWDADYHPPAAPGAVKPSAPGASAGAGSRFHLLERARDLLRRVMPRPVAMYLARRRIAAAQREAGQAAHDTVSDANVAAYKLRLSRIVADLRAAGVTPILVTHATRFGPTGEYVDPATMTEWLQYAPLITPRGMLAAERRFNDQMRAVAREQHVALVDAATRIAPGPDNFADFVHFTDAGAARFARLLAPVVRRST